MAVFNFVFEALVKHYGSPAVYARDGNPDTKPMDFDPVGMTLILCVVFAYLVVSSLLAYMILDVVAILVMVEKVHSLFVVDEVDEPLLAAETPGLTPTSGTVTSGIRKTLTYLRAEAGLSSMLRGLGYSAIYTLAEGALNSLFSGILRPLIRVFADIFVPILTALLLWAFNNAWLHKVISKPSDKSWFTRIKEQSRRRSVMPAIVLWAFCRSISTFVTQTLATFFVLSKFTIVDNKMHFADDASVKDTLLEALGIQALDLLLLLILVLPSYIILVRVQASLLPDTDEAIVPFDRTFGGKMSSESMSGNKKLTMLDAWRSFGWPAGIRLLKTYAKYFVLHITLSLLTTGVVLALYIAFV